MSKLSPEGAQRHDTCINAGAKHFSQSELQKLWNITDVNLVLAAVNELTQHSLLRTLKADRTLVWAPRLRDVAAALSNFEKDERIIYEAIENSESTGIWLKRLKQNTGVAPGNVPKIIKKLETTQLIKSIKSVKSPAQRIYMLFHLAPAEDVTGGSFFDAGDLDEGLVDELSNLIIFHVRSQSWHDVKRKPRRERDGSPIDLDSDDDDAQTSGQKRKRNGDIEDSTAPRKRREPQPQITQLAYPAGSRGYPTAESIHNFVTNSNALRPTKAASLTVREVQEVINVLVWDDKLEKVGGGYRTCLGVSFKAPGISDDYQRENAIGNGLTDAPCGKCPVFDLCAEGGPINAGNCVYFDKWLLTA